MFVHERSKRGGMICVGDSFTHDFEDGFWIAESKMSSMRICSFVSMLAPGLDEGCRLGWTVGMQSIATKWADVHIVPPPLSALTLLVAELSKERFTPASSNEARLGEVVIDVDGVEIAELIAAAVPAAAPIAPPG